MEQWNGKSMVIKPVYFPNFGPNPEVSFVIPA